MVLPSLLPVGREVASLIAGLLLVTVAIAAAIVSSYSLWEMRFLVQQSHQSRAQLRLLLVHLKGAEAGQRGFIITGDDEYLVPHRHAVEQLEPLLDRFESTAADDHPPLQEQIAELRALVAERLSVFERGVSERRVGGFEAGAQFVASGRGQDLTEAILNRVANIDRIERQRLEHRQAARNSRWRAMLASSVLAWGLGTSVVIAAVVSVLRHRRAAEAAESKFRQLFESGPGLYLVLEPKEFRIIAASDPYLQATMTQRQGVLGRCIFDVFPDDPNDPYATGVKNLRASLERVKAYGRADAMAVQRYPIPRREGEGGGFEQRWWSPLNFPVFQPNGELACIIHRVEDVTPIVLDRRGGSQADLQALETRTQHLLAGILLRGQELQKVNDELRLRDDQLQAANRELSEFATIVSHDLKSPLRAVAAICKWLQSDYETQLDETGKQYLGEIVKRVAHLDHMIDDILEYSRLGRSRGKVGPVPLNQLLNDLLDELRLPPQVSVEIAQNLPTIEGNRTRFRQVFQNLIDNAVKHNDKPRPEIRIDGSEQADHWVLSVSDNGPGIEPRHFERIFRMFQTLAPKGQTDSTGVGLSLVKRIVELAGGRVWVESHKGAGSTFYLAWPKNAIGQPTQIGSSTRRFGMEFAAAIEKAPR